MPETETCAIRVVDNVPAIIVVEAFRTRDVFLRKTVLLRGRPHLSAMPFRHGLRKAVRRSLIPRFLIDSVTGSEKIESLS